MGHFLKRHALFLVVITILNCVVVSDYFYHGSKPANFDAIAHITTIAQFHKAMSDGELPVAWGDGFANYGLPLGTIAHQIPAYLGGLLTFITHDPLLSFNLVYLIAAVMSAILFYVFLTLFFSAETALLATIFYSLAPYRIMNLYMRGAMPEFASAVWVPLLLIAMYFIQKNGRIVWYFVFGLGVLGLILTHPMMLIVYAPMLGIWALLKFRTNLRKWLRVIGTAVVALLISAYYFLPLTLEVKYLYYGSMSNYYSRNQHTTLDTFTNPLWRYNCVFRNDIFGRCQLTKGGVTETIIMAVLLGIGLSVFLQRKHIGRYFHKVRAQWDNYLTTSSLTDLFIFTLVGASVSIFFSSIALEPLYERIKVMSSIQYPWRFLSSYLFFPPIALAIMFEFIRIKKWSNYLWYGMVIFIVLARFPQIYAKNYTHIPIADYYFTPYNLHSLTMNTIWSGDSRDYPVRREKAEIIQGKGKIVKRSLKNASRVYTIQADTDVRISDNTFYFPGWHVYVDGVETTVEFQDPTYRGVITFAVPKGEHEVNVVYKDTKVRAIGKVITALSILCCGLFVVYLFTRNKKGLSRT
jgi:hypothetical protein